MQLNLLVGLFMATTGVGVVYGGLTGRLAAMIAALIKPQDLGAPGSIGANGTPDIGMSASTGVGQNQNLVTVLIRQFRALGLNKNAKAEVEFRGKFEPLFFKAQSSGAEKDYAAAIAELRNIIATYKPDSVKPGTTAKSGASLDPTAGRKPIIAPPATTGATP